MHFFRIFGSVDLLAIFADFHLRPALPHSRIFILASPRPATSLMHKKFTASHKNEEDKKRFKEVCKILISNTLGFCQPHLWISISKHNYYWKKNIQGSSKNILPLQCIALLTIQENSSADYINCKPQPDLQSKDGSRPSTFPLCRHWTPVTVGSKGLPALQPSSNY